MANNNFNRKNNVLGGIENIHRYGYEAFLRLEAASRDMQPGDLEKRLVTETIVMDVPTPGRGGSNYLELIQQLSEKYVAVTDFNIAFYRSSTIPVFSAADRAVVMGTGIREEYSPKL